MGPAFPVGSRHIAYGEVKAPPQVNTLRDEACPVCGETNAYDGHVCSVCSFVQPPQAFQDPDLDMAKKVDLRQHDGEVNDLDVGNLEQQTNDQDGDGFDDKTGEPVGAEDEMGAMDSQPLLACSNCGTEFPAGEPQTTDTRDPQMGDLGQGPAEGDVCPQCGQGELLSGGDLPPEEGQMPGADGEIPPEDPDEDEESELPFPDGDESDDEEEDDEEEDPRPSKKNKDPFTK